MYPPSPGHLDVCVCVGSNVVVHTPPLESVLVMTVPPFSLVVVERVFGGFVGAAEDEDVNSVVVGFEEEEEEEVVEI